jgi:hypothetical protein
MVNCNNIQVMMMYSGGTAFVCLLVMCEPLSRVRSNESFCRPDTSVYKPLVAIGKK